MAANNPGADEIVKQRHVRAFSQRGGPSPLNRVRYAGADEQYLAFGDVSNPVRGGVEAVRVHDPQARGAYRLVSMSQSAPDLPSATLTFKRRHGGLTWLAGSLTCPNNFYELVGTCGEPDNFTYGWSDFVTIYSKGLASGRSHQGRTSFTDDDDMADEIEMTFTSVYDIGSLVFGQVAGPQVEREAVDAVYASSEECGGCGVVASGVERIYVLTQSSGAGSPGIPAEVVYTTDGQTWKNVNITGMGTTVDPNAIDVMGSFLVVVSTPDGGYYYSEIDALTGDPGVWTRVTLGFQTGNPPTDIYVAGSSEAYLSGRNGRVYKCADPVGGVSVSLDGSLGTAHLLRVDGVGETIVAVGESGLVVRSANNGATWSALASPTSNTLRAVCVLDRYRYWIGSAAGGVWYTVNGGETWTQLTISSAQVIDDIVFATEEVGYILFRAPNATTARLWTTYNGGRDWSSSNVSSNPRLINFPTFTRGNRIAVPRGVSPFVGANNLIVVGLAAGGLDGIAVRGVANVW